MRPLSGVARARAIGGVCLAALLLAGCGTTPGPQGQDSGPVDSAGQIVQLSTTDVSTYFELENTANEGLDWHLEVDDSSDNPQSGRWFSIRPSEGHLEPYGRQLVTLVQEDDLVPGTYRSLVRVLYQDGVTVFEVIGEVEPSGSRETGDGSIRGRLLTDNGRISLDAPSTLRAEWKRQSSMGPGGTGHSQVRPQLQPGRLVVAFEREVRQNALSEDATNGAERLARSFAQRHGLELAHEVNRDRRVVFELAPGSDPVAVAARLQRDPQVLYATPNHLYYPHALPNDPLLDDAWQLPVIGAPVAWNALDGQAGAGPVVAVLDSGIDIDHEDLQGVFVSGGYDFCASSGCDTTDSSVLPESQHDVHGTHVTGLVAAVGNNGRGLAGAIPTGARVLPVKVFYTSSNQTISSTADALVDAIEWAAGMGDSNIYPANPYPADIITLSLGGPANDLVEDAIERARDSGALVIASAGNQSEANVDYPARYSSVIGVGSVNSSFVRSCFSDFGEGLDIMAPGGDGFRCSAPRNEAIRSTVPGNRYELQAGTSMAAPLVAGGAALIWGTMVEPTADRVRDRLLENTYRAAYMDEQGYGAGVLRMDTAVGFPGPGDEATVQAVGPSTALDVVTLERDGTSNEFELGGLAAGSYTVAGEANGRSRALSGELSVQLGSGEERTITVPLGEVGR